MASVAVLSQHGRPLGTPAGVAGSHIASPHATTIACANIGALTGMAGGAATATATD